MWVYLNQQFVEDDQARISVFDRGFLFGDGVFETLRVYDTRLLFLNRHLQRLHQSCELLGLSLPTPHPEWETLLQEVVERNDLHHSMIRITISRGVGGVGPDPSGCSNSTIVMFPRPVPQLSKDQKKHGVSLTILNTRRQPSLALPSQVKSLNYLNNILAKQEAINAHTFDGILLNTEGFLAECTTSNFFFAKEQRLHTPSLQCGILPGITREIVLELAKEEGIDVQEGMYQPEDLWDADEAFLTNTGFGVLPVNTIETRPLTSSRERSITKTIQHLYEKHIAESI
ncbi:aminodeoxychorismate lyase [Candidatus Nitronereus thalassa]|uniref:Aminodeoxychorismate lyase n=1 Tax=Candidatus Nitronereus thalassa TaxID=3020898 RepID=A0ABU3K9W9_9BACT|nr:aminodeoxychorismate lyase [Candidatus Nitronereus thalassa]MDT7043240.1 aminodeoxychorismate lyase [Candidatus Nitronereus thalassa]